MESHALLPLKSVLVIDDDPSILEIVMTILHLRGLRATGATNGREGLEELNRNRHDAILCDIVMPEMDGIAFLRALRADHRMDAIPLIFVSAFPDPRPMLGELSSPGIGFLRKPFDEDSLMNALAAAMTPPGDGAGA